MHQGALGDFLLALPIIEAIASAFSPLRFTFWAPRRHTALLHGKNYLGSGFDSADGRWAPLYSEAFWKEAPLPPGLAEAGLILVLGQESSRVLAERLGKRVNGSVHWLKSFPAAGERIHVTDFLEEQARACSLPLHRKPFRLLPDANRVADVRVRLSERNMGREDKLVVLHPGSGGFKKIWPLSRWCLLVHWLSTLPDVRIAVVLGPADERIRHWVLEVGAAAGAAILEDLSLPALGALLSEASLYIGNDSGVTHLATSFGTPTIALFGPTDPIVWGPRGPWVEIIRDTWAEDEILAPGSSPSLSEPEARVRKAVTDRLV